MTPPGQFAGATGRKVLFSGMTRRKSCGILGVGGGESQPLGGESLLDNDVHIPESTAETWQQTLHYDPLTPAFVALMLKPLSLLKAHSSHFCNYKSILMYSFIKILMKYY